MNPSLSIRPAVPADLPTVMQIYACARQYMRTQGNPTQWAGGYPPEALIREDIAQGYCHLCCDAENGEILGVFCFFIGEDPTYRRIEDGAWLNDAPYGVIHRIAVGENAHRRGVASFCFAYAFERCGNVKIDTHLDNLPMQRSLEKNGFVRCGTIHLANGDPRIAYQKAQK
ncbi:MAG: GNAT family N-acetyltransferase [Clostridia bacterium]|nr:GNAT family N-acetyltransferase [Clostridia bacterium]